MSAGIVQIRQVRVKHARTRPRLEPTAKVGLARLNGDDPSRTHLSELQPKERIDLNGLAVCPGFIDLHTHSDFTLLVNGRAESQVHQGVTTEVVGQCGHSCAPVARAGDATLGDAYRALRECRERAPR